MSSHALIRKPPSSAEIPEEKYYVTVRIAGQLVGLSVEHVEDVLPPQTVTPIPLSPPEVAGSLNLRGRVVTAIDLRQRLGLPLHGDASAQMSTVVSWQGHLYSFLIDEVGDVMRLAANRLERTPPNLDAHWKAVATHVCKLETELMIIISVPAILNC